MNADLEKILEKQYEASARIERKFRGKDITLITNEEGQPVTIFIGRRKPNGDISGERYVRNTKTVGTLTKSHWERKGKV